MSETPLNIIERKGCVLRPVIDLVLKFILFCDLLGDIDFYSSVDLHFIPQKPY